MVKGNWREFDDSSSQCTSLGQLSVQDGSQVPVRVERTRAGRGGKTVTIITGLMLENNQLRPLLKKLKSSCGTGGSLKGDSIELQGDHVNSVLQFLEKKGYRPKQKGG